VDENSITTHTEEENFLSRKHKRNIQMQGDKVSNETKEGAVERFMKGLTRKNKVKRYQAYGEKIPTVEYGPRTVEDRFGRLYLTQVKMN